MTSPDRPLDAGNQGDAAFPRAVSQTRTLELSVVECDRQCAETELGRAIDDVSGAVWNPVERVFSAMNVKVYFEHVGYLNAAPEATAPGAVEANRNLEARRLGNWQTICQLTNSPIHQLTN